MKTIKHSLTKKHQTGVVKNYEVSIYQNICFQCDNKHDGYTKRQPSQELVAKRKRLTTQKNQTLNANPNEHDIASSYNIKQVIHKRHKHGTYTFTVRSCPRPQVILDYALMWQYEKAIERSIIDYPHFAGQPVHFAGQPVIQFLHLLGQLQPCKKRCIID
jgi:hypothetical protein